MTLRPPFSPSRPAGRPARPSRQRLMAHLPHLPELLGIAPSGPYLHGLTPRGPLMLYRFAPLQAAILTGQTVPFAAHWPEYLKLFVYAYAPVPTLSPAGLPPGLEARFGTRPRDQGGLRPWDQATYQGWPLYVCTLDQPGRRTVGEVTAMFEAVSIDLLPLPEPGSEGHGP